MYRDGNQACRPEWRKRNKEVGGCERKEKQLKMDKAQIREPYPLFNRYLRPHAAVVRPMTMTEALPASRLHAPSALASLSRAGSVLSLDPSRGFMLEQGTAAPILQQAFAGLMISLFALLLGGAQSMSAMSCLRSRTWEHVSSWRSRIVLEDSSISGPYVFDGFRSITVVRTG
jgi:hypothetical protein